LHRCKLWNTTSRLKLICSDTAIVGLPSSGPKQSMPYGSGSAGVGMNDTLRSDSVALCRSRQGSYEPPSGCHRLLLIVNLLK
jgi:hypothetical protein